MLASLGNTALARASGVWLSERSATGRQAYGHGEYLFPDRPVLHLNSTHRKVTWVSSCQDRTYGPRRRGDQAVRLRQCGPLGRELASPFASLPAFRAPDGHDAEAIEKLPYRYGFRRTQASNDLLDVDGGSAWRVAMGKQGGDALDGRSSEKVIDQHCCIQKHKHRPIQLAVDRRCAAASPTRQGHRPSRVRCCEVFPQPCGGNSCGGTDQQQPGSTPERTRCGASGRQWRQSQLRPHRRVQCAFSCVVG